MRIFFFSIILVLLSGCSKPKTVFICGDHVCINKSEAKQYFEENLTIEVRIVDKKIKKKTDLIELNLKENQTGKREIALLQKKQPKNKLKTLSNEEIIKIKKEIKDKKKKKISKIVSKSDSEKTQKEITKKKTKINDKEIFENIVNKKRIKVVDVCKILEECSIDEISEYLIEQGKKKKFPDITGR